MGSQEFVPYAPTRGIIIRAREDRAFIEDELQFQLVALRVAGIHVAAEESGSVTFLVLFFPSSLVT